MTTAKSPARDGRPSGYRLGRVLTASLVATLLVGFVGVVLAALLSGAPAARGVAIGTAMVVLFFGGGTLVVDAVAAVSPRASLLVALLTYTLQVVLAGMVLAGLHRSGALDGDVSGTWLGGTVIAGTTAWSGTLLVRSVRTRQPLYDLPLERPDVGAR